MGLNKEEVVTVEQQKKKKTYLTLEKQRSTEKIY